MNSTAILFSFSFLLLIWMFPGQTNAIYGNKTFSIGGIFDVYKSATRDKINPQIGIHFQEAYRFAISEINDNKSILHGFKLTEKIATTEIWNDLIMNILQFFYLPAAPTAIGPFESLDAYRLSILTNSLGYSLVSYAAGFDITDAGSGEFFFRTVPTDSFRVIAITELLKKLKWNFVSVISSHAQNGDVMARNFIKKASLYDVCYSTHTSLASQPKKSDYRQALQIAATNKQAKGLVLFTSMKDSLNLLQELKSLNLTNRFHIISATGLTNYVEVTDGNEAALDGSISLESATTEIPKFKDYFLSLNLNKRKTKDFQLFWEQTFNCKLTKNSKSGTPNCTGTEKLEPGKGYYPNTPVHQVIDSIYALALANKYVIEKNCANKAYCDWDPNASHYYVSSIQRFLRANSFLDYTLKFSNPITNRTPYVVEYDILNYVRTRHGYENRKVGKWSMRRDSDSKGGTDYLWGTETGKMTLEISELRFRGQKSNSSSSCRVPCRNGQVYTRNTGFHLTCCWTCRTCKFNEITVNNSCVACSAYMKPDPEFRTCKRIKQRSFGTHGATFIAARVYLGFSALGILSTIFVAAVFVKNNNNRIVRASGRDLCYFILAGIGITFVVPVTYFLEPNNIVCTIRAVIPGIAFCMCYSPLFLKTNRIYRIFRNAQTSISRPPLISPQSQLIILFCILCVQVLLGIASIISNKDVLHSFIPETRDYIVFYCNDEIAPMLFNLLLSVVFMVCCTWYAFKTRNFPKNYNESKYIGITMYITCICWAVYLPTSIISKQDGDFIRAHLMCIIAIFIAFLNLIGLFGQKIKLLLFPRLIVQTQAQNAPSQVSPEQNRLNGKLKIHTIDALSMCKEEENSSGVIANEKAR